LVDLASNDNVYAGSWLDSATQYNTDNQTSAIDVLLGGLVVGGDTTTSSGSLTSPTASSSTNTAGPNAAHKDNLGATVGGAIGGTFVLSMIGLLVWLRVRQRRRTAMTATAVTPFEETAAETIDQVHLSDNLNDREKQLSLPGPPRNGVSSTSITSRSDGVTQETSRSSRAGLDHREEGQRVNIGSQLVRELDELIRRRYREDSEGENPPAYTTSSSGINPTT
jgi:hypothetical protein